MRGQADRRRVLPQQPGNDGVDGAGLAGSALAPPGARQNPQRRAAMRQGGCLLRIEGAERLVVGVVVAARICPPGVGALRLARQWPMRVGVRLFQSWARPCLGHQGHALRSVRPAKILYK